MPQAAVMAMAIESSIVIRRAASAEMGKDQE